MYKLVSILRWFEFSPDGGLFELRSVIVLAALEFIFGLAPSETIVPEASESSVGDSEHEGGSDHEEQVGDAVIHDEALGEHGEGTRDCVGPQDAGAVDGACHHEV